MSKLSNTSKEFCYISSTNTVSYTNDSDSLFSVAQTLTFPVAIMPDTLAHLDRRNQDGNKNYVLIMEQNGLSIQQIQIYLLKNFGELNLGIVLK